jgi:hypothetical protein
MGQSLVSASALLDKHRGILRDAVTAIEGNQQ